MQFSASRCHVWRGRSSEEEGCEIWVMRDGRHWDQWRNMYQSWNVVGGGDGRKGRNVNDRDGVGFVTM